MIRRRTPQLQAVLVGYGVGGSVFHAPIVNAVPGIDLGAIVTSNPDRRAAALQRYPSIRLYDDPVDAFRYAGGDLAIIATPNRYHAILAKAALSAGLHVVLDKPLAGSAAEAMELRKSADRLGLLIIPYQNRRWDGDFRTIQKLIYDGRLGAVFRFESRFERWRPTVRSGSWKESGNAEDLGGALYDLGVHLIDQAICLFGCPLQVYAELDRRRNNTLVDDDTYIAMTHSDGVRAHLWMSSAASDLGPRFRVLGSKTSYVKYGMDPQEAALRSGASPNDEEWGMESPDAWGRLGTPEANEPIPTLQGRYQEFYLRVVSAITEGTDSPVAIDDVIKGLAVVEAAQRSARYNRIERITDTIGFANRFSTANLKRDP